MTPAEGRLAMQAMLRGKPAIASTPSAPRAICLAALKALEVADA